ncbi:hypothetical protein TNIN_103981 [Trichonephila inaurata madagascariensis]|uniref:Uncharacterized protein n=1 Tax=Trichonephila inaurata madagascariensis TaxID=2747483 RepID=A0A8X7BZT5_9ARAC|nr:hypothetical protein TNIN_103981 [Trichonephila inaurata madagascariensis]
MLRNQLVNFAYGLYEIFSPHETQRLLLGRLPQRATKLTSPKIIQKFLWGIVVVVGSDDRLGILRLPSCGGWVFLRLERLLVIQYSLL